MKNAVLKTTILLASIFCFMNSAMAEECSNEMADSIVAKKLAEIASIYKAKKVGIGHTISLGQFRSTNIIVLGGNGGSEGPVDRIGSIVIDSAKCRYHSYLIGVYSTYETTNNDGN